MTNALKLKSIDPTPADVSDEDRARIEREVREFCHRKSVLPEAVPDVLAFVTPHLVVHGKHDVVRTRDGTCDLPEFVNRFLSTRPHWFDPEHRPGFRHAP